MNSFILLYCAVFFSCMPVQDKQNQQLAEVVSVKVSGTEQSYSFAVGILSPDKGCEQYADWWEVITEDGQLIYRRILGHSHVDEQPFIRSGGDVVISKDAVVIIRAHMNNLGYGTIVLKGSVSTGFINTNLNNSFASHLIKEAPLPTRCAF